MGNVFPLLGKWFPLVGEMCSPCWGNYFPLLGQCFPLVGALGKKSLCWGRLCTMLRHGADCAPFWGTGQIVPLVRADCAPCWGTGQIVPLVGADFAPCWGIGPNISPDWGNVFPLLGHWRKYFPVVEATPAPITPYFE